MILNAHRLSACSCSCRDVLMHILNVSILQKTISDNQILNMQADYRFLGFVWGFVCLLVCCCFLGFFCWVCLGLYFVWVFGVFLFCFGVVVFFFLGGCCWFFWGGFVGFLEGFVFNYFNFNFFFMGRCF